MPHQNSYDAAIAGGGLAGLALSIQLARLGHSVILFEKEQYPFHKVCGEYISLESWDFLVSLGVDLDQLNVPIINHLELSSQSGKSVRHALPLGGFGLSRYVLENTLAVLARQAGVIIMENTKVTDIKFINDQFNVEVGQQIFLAKIACGTFGKRSNVDIKWQRNFTRNIKSKFNNYIGVKYHIHSSFESNTVGLHLFDNGYCGIVKIEGNRYNLCYLTTAANLQKCNNDLRQMEQTILSRNPNLEVYFSGPPVSEDPVVISQISFAKKSQVENHVLMIGDAAGMITPLCGNGMSMALHASKIAATHMNSFLKGHITREKMESRYAFHWRKQFSARLATGRNLQRILGIRSLTDLFLRSVRTFPSFLDLLIRKTHGKRF